MTWLSTLINKLFPLVPGVVDYLEFDEVSQLSHTGWGIAVFSFPASILMVADASGSLTRVFLLSVTFLWVTYAAVKEFILDEHDETPVVRGSSAKDFTFQTLGIVIASVPFWILYARHFHL